MTESTSPRRHLNPLIAEGFSKRLRRNNAEGLRPHDPGWLEDFELDNAQSLSVVSGP